MKENPLIQALEYVRKESGKTSFVFAICYAYPEYASLNSFSKENMQKIAKRFYTDAESIVLVEFSPSEYLVIGSEKEIDFDENNIHNSTFNRDTKTLILATNDLAPNKNLSFEIENDAYEQLYADLINEEKPIKKIISFNGLGKKEETLKRVKAFNDRRFGNGLKPEMKKQFTNLPMSYRGHKSAPKRKTGLRQLENSVRKMW